MQNKKEAKKNLPHSSFFPKNQRGQGLSTTAIILIVLGIAVLVLLIIGFTTGWENIAFWIPSNNVDTIVNQCAAACTTRSVYDFCTRTRELKASDLPNDADGKAQKSVTKSCYFFSIAGGYEPYGIEECSGLCSTIYTYSWKTNEAECLAEEGYVFPNQCEVSATPEEGTPVCCGVTA